MAKGFCNLHYYRQPDQILKKRARGKKRYHSMNEEQLEKKRQRVQIWRKRNHNELLQRRRDQYRANREHVLELTYKWRKENPEKVRTINRKYMKSNTPAVLSRKLAKNLRTRLLMALKGNTRTGSAVRDLGCSMEEFKTRLKSQFKLGMNWENYGKWHIDHILPLSKFDLSKEKERLVAFHYSNLQPLWAEDNNRKSNRIT